ncbi:gliding motility-associated C-terminal domain-containing protein [Leeuwenhoekiella sp. MAR_2009_132]|uniref:T9SS type B sorting domain-containing protein n=1 Tax=Leeuwenhoekiella sp. MAR_2009_132 TaxID=1392489 RepID=UPI00048D2BC0|nr:gliding motility-associated C-terminal domain-containing protein [Leeuwenhoekiella sp. MAR_2009_132]
MNFVARFSLIIFAYFVVPNIYCQVTAIPDSNFEQDLIAQGYDTNGLNGNILDADAAAVIAYTTGRNDITDFTGLEAFVNIENINTNSNLYSTIPLNTLTRLTEFRFSNNQLITNLDFSNNPNLKILNITASIRTPIPTITTLDLSNNLFLERVNISVFASITSLTFPITPTLVDIDVAQLSVPVFDLSKLEGDVDFRIIGSRVDTKIIYPTNPTALKKLELSSINFPQVDASSQIGLERLGIFSCDIEDLILPETNTLNYITIWGHKFTSLLDFSIVPQLTDLDIRSNNGNVPLRVNLRDNLELTDLNFTGDLMSELDISQNSKLRTLRLYNNLFTDIDITNNPVITTFDGYDNLLTDIDLTKNLYLKYLNISQNKIPNLDVKLNTELNSLNISKNLFVGSGIDLTQNTELSSLDVSYNQIERLDITQNIKLSRLNISHNLFPGNDILNQFATIVANTGRLNGSLIANNNLLSGPIPDFYGLYDPAVQTRRFQLYINDNEFHFGDFEDQHFGLVDLTTTQSIGPSPDVVIQNYEYAPQAKVNPIENYTPNPGDNLTLTTTVRGSQNHYKWFKDGIELPDAPDSPNLVLENINSCDAGVYYSEITSDLVPFENSNPPGTNGKNLLLVRNDITLTLNYTEQCSALLNPADGAVNVTRNPTITWQDRLAACSYILNVGTTSGGGQILNDIEVVDANFYQFVNNLPANTEFFVKVTPVYASGPITNTCTIRSFTTNTTQLDIPTCTNLIAPSDNSADVAVDTNLSWTPITNATGYFLTIGTFPGGGDILPKTDVGNSTTFNPATNFANDTSIFITINPYNADGENLGCNSEQFRTERAATLQPPSCTSLTSPLNGATDVAVETDLSWNAAPTATSYLLSVGTTAGATDILNEFSVTTTTYDLPNNLPENTQIFVTIVPVNSAGNATGCIEESFTTETVLQPPSCTSLTSPLNGATDVAVETDLSWNAVPTATSYLLSVGTTAGATDILNEFSVTTTTYDLPNNLPENTQIFVTIVPVNAAGSATGCSEESFTTQTVLQPPSCTSLISPLDGETDVAVETDLSWNAVPTATSYLLSVGTTTGGTDILDAVSVTGITYNIANNLPENTIVFVRIIPVNAAGNATGCIEESFTTETVLQPPSCTSLTSPLNGATGVAVETDLSWNAAPTATSYLLYVGTTAGATDILNEFSVTTTTYDFPNNLPENTQIFVTIVPVNAAGRATGCIEESFTTETLLQPPSCTSLTSPLNGATNVALETDLSWNAVPTATSYLLSVGTTTGGTDILDAVSVTGITYNIANNLPENTMVFVRIIPVNSAGNATDCIEESFTTETVLQPPSCTSLTSPLDGETDVAVETDLNWNTAPTATSYLLSVGTTAGGSQILDAVSVTGTTYNLINDLPENTTVFVRITPVNSAGNATGCIEESFTTITSIVPHKLRYGISPDGDGINEFWEIEQITDYPENLVQVFNRWGDLVFETINYDNINNVFRGIANRKTNMGANMLPEGTYFFRIDLKGGTEPQLIEGFIVLKR